MRLDYRNVGDGDGGMLFLPTCASRLCKCRRDLYYNRLVRPDYANAEGVLCCCFFIGLFMFLLPTYASILCECRGNLYYCCLLVRSNYANAEGDLCYCCLLVLADYENAEGDLWYCCLLVRYVTFSQIGSHSIICRNGIAVLNP